MKDKLSFFTSRSMFTGIAISYLFTICGTSFWLADILGTILGLLILLSVKNRSDIRIVKYITGIVLSIISLTILVNMGHTLYLRNTPLILLVSFPVICCAIISTSKKTALIRIANIFFIYSIFLFFLKIFGLYSHIDMNNLLPMNSAPYRNIIFGAIVYMMVSVVPVLSLNDISDKKNTIIMYLVSSITISMVSFLAIGVLGYKEVQLYRYPEYVMLKRIEFLNFVNNVDNFLNFAIILDLIFTISLSFKNIDIKGKKLKYITIIGITFLTIYICERSSLLLLIYDYLPYIFIFLLILLLIPKK